MNNELMTASLKKLLGEAMLLGMRVSQTNFEGELYDNTNDLLYEQISRFHESAERFGSEVGLDETNISELAPLIQEINFLMGDSNPWS